MPGLVTVDIFLCIVDSGINIANLFALEGGNISLLQWGGLAFHGSHILACLIEMAFSGFVCVRIIFCNIAFGEQGPTDKAASFNGFEGKTADGMSPVDDLFHRGQVINTVGFQEGGVYSFLWGTRLPLSLVLNEWDGITPLVITDADKEWFALAGD